jgi:hypothetical protein
MPHGEAAVAATPGLGVDSLRAGGERDVPVHHRATAAGLDVEVEAVFEHPCRSSCGEVLTKSTEAGHW